MVLPCRVGPCPSRFLLGLAAVGTAAQTWAAVAGLGETWEGSECLYEHTDEAPELLSLLQVQAQMRPTRGQGFGNLSAQGPTSGSAPEPPHRAELSQLSASPNWNPNQCYIPDLPNFGTGAVLTFLSMAFVVLILFAVSGSPGMGAGTGTSGRPLTDAAAPGEGGGNIKAAPCKDPRAHPASDRNPAASTATGRTSKTVSDATAPVPTKQMLALDGLRTLLISNVIMGHQRMGETLVLKTVGGTWWPLRPIQHPSMSFFMILSGFVRYQAAKGRPCYDRAATRNYVARILARFVPAYYAALLLIMFFAAVNRKGTSFVAWPLNALFLQTLLPFVICHGASERALAPENIPYLPFEGNLVAWFTSGVVWSSLLFPLVYNVIRPERGKRGAAVVFMTLLTVISIPVSMQCLHFLVYGQDRLFTSPLLRPIFDVENGHFLPYRLLECVLGMLSAWFFDELSKPWREWRGWVWVFDGAIVALLLLSWAPSPGPENSEIVIHLSYAPKIALSLILWSLVMISSRGAVELPGSGSSGLLIRALGCRPLASLAKYSFGAYIYQQAAIGFLSATGMYTDRVSQSSALWWLPLPATWFMGYVSEHLLEGPIRRAVESRTRGSGAARK